MHWAGVYLPMVFHKLFDKSQKVIVFGVPNGLALIKEMQISFARNYDYIIRIALFFQDKGAMLASI